MKLPFFLLLLILSSRPQSSGSLDEALGLYRKGDFRQAVNLLRQLRSSSPADPDISFWLGKSYIKIHQWDNGVHELEKAVQLQSANAQYHLWLGRACGARASHSFFALAYHWARRVAKEFETAKTLAPEDLDIRFDLLEFYLNAPGIVGGGKEKAEAEARAISALDPQKGCTARAIILQKGKNWELAKKELLQAASDYPNNADAYKDLAEYLFNRQDYAGALRYAKKALALDGESKQAWLLAAAARIRLHAGLDQAAGILRELAEGRLSEDDPAFDEVYYWLGECYLAQGDKAKAREAFESALAFNADCAKAKEGISELK